MPRFAAASLNSTAERGFQKAETESLQELTIYQLTQQADLL
jgi:hypothetical protein